MKHCVVINSLLHTRGWIAQIVHYGDRNDAVVGFSTPSALGIERVHVEDAWLCNKFVSERFTLICFSE